MLSLKHIKPEINSIIADLGEDFTRKALLEKTSFTRGQLEWFLHNNTNYKTINQFLNSEFGLNLKIPNERPSEKQISEELLDYYNKHNCLPTKKEYLNEGFSFCYEMVQRVTGKVPVDYMRDKHGIELNLTLDRVKEILTQYLKEYGTIERHEDFTQRAGVSYVSIGNLVRKELDLTMNEYINKEFDLGKKEPSAPGRLTNASKETIIAEYKKLVKELGHVPPVRQLEKLNFGMHPNTIGVKFGCTYNDFVRLCGFEPNVGIIGQQDNYAKDGNRFRSIAEVVFANLLFAAGVKYQYEERYDSIIPNLNRNFKFDFTFTYQGTKYRVEITSDRGKNNGLKQALCIEHNIFCIWIDWSDVYEYKDLPTLIDDYS